MLHFAYFLEEFRGIPPREPPISGTRVTTNWAGERPTRHCQVGICIAVSCRFSLCAVELPASCAGAAVRAPASQVRGPRSESEVRDRGVSARSQPPEVCVTREAANQFIQHNTIIYLSYVTHELVTFTTSYRTLNISSRNSGRNIWHFTPRPYVVCASSRVSACDRHLSYFICSEEQRGPPNGRARKFGLAGDPA